MCKRDSSLAWRSGASSLFPSQRALADTGYVDSDSHWLICAPTGSGKTLMGEWAIERAWSQGLSAAYIAPLRAIVDERLVDWEKLYPERRVVAYTGTSAQGSKPQSDDHLLLFTPEKFASYLSSWKIHLPWLSRLGVLVIDELHVIGDSSRGAVLESLIGRLERVNPFVKIVGLSATLSNSKEVAAWLNASLFESSWRPVPVTHRLLRYKRPTDKPDHLANEIELTRDAGGHTLVFVNSRRRAESLASYLEKQQFKVAFTHAGLNAQAQSAIHAQMKAGELDALVATSTLEMGVNLPARKVVIYDNYSFEGDTFQPMRVQRYLQFAGRAGRPGLDTTGEAVLFAPIWDGHADQCLTGTPEPVRSGLFGSNHLAREVLYEVSGRLSVSEVHLEVNFASRTLWRHQGGQKNLTSTVQSLVKGGLLRSTEKGDRTYLSHTALGKIATQMSLSPATIIMLAKFYAEVSHPSDFDLLLVTCLSEEVTPKLGFNFEEIDHFGDLVQQAQSNLLDRPVAKVSGLRARCTEQALLSAVKCATILHEHTHLENLDALADRFDCYPSDLNSLKRNSVWVLEAAQRVFAVLNRQDFYREHEDEDDPGKPPRSIHEQLVEAVKLMVEYGVPKGAISLVQIEGIGAKRAQRLCSENIFTAQHVARIPAVYLGDLLGLSEKTAERILTSACKLASSATPYPDFIADGNQSPEKGRPILRAVASVDPYRLRRALELQVDHLSSEVVRISGGAEPHTVNVSEDQKRRRIYACDCADFAKGHASCKHVLRTRMALHDDEEFRPMLIAFTRPNSEQPLRYALGDLWMNAGKTYESYSGHKGVAPMAKAQNTVTAERKRRDR